jgi:hypothetical protein
MKIKNLLLVLDKEVRQFNKLDYREIQSEKEYNDYPLPPVELEDATFREIFDFVFEYWYDRIFYHGFVFGMTKEEDCMMVQQLPQKEWNKTKELPLYGISPDDFDMENDGYFMTIVVPGGCTCYSTKQCPDNGKKGWTIIEMTGDTFINDYAIEKIKERMENNE